MSDVSCTAAEAVARAQSMVNNGGQYILGTGDYWPPGQPGGVDVPWTTNQYGCGSDCAGFAICYCWKIHRHRVPFNRGSWATVSDDLNVNSAVEDALHNRELFTLVLGFDAGGNWNLGMPKPGDLLCYVSVTLKHEDGSPAVFIGHVAIIETVPADYKPGEGYRRLGLIQCHGPNHFTPGVVATDGHGFDLHDANWPTVAHCVIIRPAERP